MIDTLKSYKEAGLSCLPVQANKRPSVNELKSVDIAEKEFKGAHGIALKCGSESGDIEVLDFDNHFGDAKDILTKFFSDDKVKEIYEKYGLPIEETKGGGFHVFYRAENIEGNQKLASRPKLENNRWKPEALIETRGEGGYVIVDPTEGYNIKRGSITNISEIKPKERDILIRNAKAFNEFKELKERYDEREDRPGDQYNQDPKAIEDAQKILENNGWVHVTKYGWRRPGKEDGVSATFGYVDDHIFYNFSSNSYPFDPDTAYTPFQIKALLEYDGNFENCAKDLAKHYGVDSHPIGVQQPQQKTELEESELKKMLKNAKIDLSKQVEKPPTILEVHGNLYGQQRLLTLGNFSSITGKSKSKKTFLMTMMAASMQVGGLQFNKFEGKLPKEKREILHFDTEQGEYDAWNTAKRVERMTGSRDKYHSFCLREYSAKERCQIIEYAIENTPNLGLVIIDGIADLATAINDEDEGTRVSQLLLKWTKENNCHVMTIIHQNKRDDYATGHLGSFVMKKSEVVLSVKKDESDPKVSNVKCDLIRGASEFEPFGFTVNLEGLPEIVK